MLAEHSASHKYIYFAVGLISGLLLVQSSIMGLDLSYLPGDLGDTRFNIYVLENARKFIEGGSVYDFWNIPCFYPEKEALTLSDNLLGSAPFYALFRWLGLDSYSAFQAWYIFLTVANFSFAWLLGMRLFKMPAAATLMAFVFAFSLSLIGHMAHAQLFPRFPMPIGLLALLLWFEQPKAWKLALAIGALTWQFYCGVYLGLLFSLLFLFVAIGGMIQHRKKMISHLLRPLNILQVCLILALNLWLLYWLFEPYIRRSETMFLLSYGDIKQTIPTMVSYFSSHPSSYLWFGTSGILNHYPAFYLHWIFPGWITMLSFLIVAGASFWFLIKKAAKPSWYNSEVGLLIGAGILTFFCYLRFGHSSLYEWVRELPGFVSMRSMTRIVNIHALLWGICVASIFVWLSTKIKIQNAWIFSITFILLLFDNAVVPSRSHHALKREMQNRQFEVEQKIKHLPAGSVVSYQPDSITDGPLQNIDAMLACQALQLKCINGYSGTSPVRYDRYWAAPNDSNRIYWLSQFDLKKLPKIHIIH